MDSTKAKLSDLKEKAPEVQAKAKENFAKLQETTKAKASELGETVGTYKESTAAMLRAWRQSGEAPASGAAAPSGSDGGGEVGASGPGAPPSEDRAPASAPPSMPNAAMTV